MKTLQNIGLGILILLSFSSGVTKVLLMPQEIEFFGSAGFSNWAIIGYGISQIAGAALLIPAGTRMIASFYLAANYLLSVIVIALSGNIPFALFSLLPVAIALSIGIAILKTHKDPSDRRQES